MASSLRTRSLPLRQLRPRFSLPHPAPRRFASSHSSHAHDASGPTTEGFGKSFYYTLLLIPTGYLMYNLSLNSTSTSGGMIGSIIKAYGDLRQDWLDRNALHTRMVEQAGRDKNLFINSRMPNYIELKAPEGVFNGGSPFNVPAGHGVNLDKVVARYHEQHLRDEDEKHARMAEERGPRALNVGEGRSSFGTIIAQRPTAEAQE